MGMDQCKFAVAKVPKPAVPGMRAVKIPAATDVDMLDIADLNVRLCGHGTSPIS